MLVFRFYSPLRSLLREASNQSSDSVVCFGTLRPLRSLREVCLRAVMSFFARRLRRERRVFFFSVLRWRWRGRKLRYDESAQRRERLFSVFRSIHLPASSYPLPFGTPPVSGGESGYLALFVPLS